MTRIAKFTAIAAVVIAGPAFAAATIDANLELDNTFYNKAASDDKLQQGGRVEVNVGAKTTVGSGFVAAKGTLLIKKDGTTGADDMWVQGGNDGYSVKLGRFEATDLGPLGKDTLVMDEVFYRGNDGRGRQGGTNFHGALNANLGAGLGFELGLMETRTDSGKTGFGYRPVVTFGAAGATFKVGLDKTYMVGANQTGFAATAGFKVAGGDINVNVASRKKAASDAVTPLELATKLKNNTFGINGTFGAFGAGLEAGKVDGVSGNTLYAAYSVPFFVPAASLTFAASTAKFKNVDRETGLRARINYGF